MIRFADLQVSDFFGFSCGCKKSLVLIPVHRIGLEVNTVHIIPVLPESFRNETHCSHSLLSLEFHFLLAVFGSPLPDKRFDGRK